MTTQYEDENPLEYITRITKEHRKKILKKMLNRKESKQVLNGERLKWDYEQRLKIEKLKIHQSNLYDEQGIGDYKKYMKIQSEIDDITRKLEGNLLFEIMIVKLQDELETLEKQE